MTDILVLLLLVTLLFLALLWPVRWLARLLGAERSGYGPVAVAVGSSLVIGLLIQIFLSTEIDWPFILAANFVIDVALFTFLLGISIPSGLFIAVFENLFGAGLLTAAIFGLHSMGLGGSIIADGMMLLSGDNKQKSSIESYADAVCDCRRDKGCLRDRFAELVFMASQAEDQSPGSDAHQQTLRARLCVTSGSRERSQTAAGDGKPPTARSNNTPLLTLPSAKIAPPQADTNSVTAVAPTAPATPPITAPAAAPAPAPVQTPALNTQQRRRARWTYTEAPLANSGSYINKQVRITRKDNGRIVSGILTPSKRGSAIALEQNRYGGVFVMYIPKSQIRRLEIRTLTPR